MNGFDRFEVRLPELIDELAVARTPDYLDDILSRTARSRQRPGWTFPERWLPMSAVSERRLFVPRVPLRTIAAVALVILALIAGALFVAGSRRPTIPPPFGPAANGRIAYADASGSIFAVDPLIGHPDLLAKGPGLARPAFSPDGTLVAYLSAGSHAAGLINDIVVARADGHDPVTVTPQPLFVTYVGWSPDGRFVAAVDGSSALTMFDVMAHERPRVIAEGVQVGSDDFNPNAASLFRPPDGRQLLFLRGQGASKRLYVADADGSHERALVDRQAGGLAYTDLWAAQWSPDGSKIAFQAFTDDFRIFVMNADGSDVHQLAKLTRPLSEANAAWSPDGTRIAMQRWFIDTASGKWETRRVTVVDVATGAESEVGILSTNGYLSWAWSPDGRSLLELSDTHNLVITDVTDGTVRTQPWPADSPLSWQRVLP